jgi:hypothetical protein
MSYGISGFADEGRMSGTAELSNIWHDALSMQLRPSIAVA